MAPMAPERFPALRRAAERRGRRGEFMAALLLLAKGYRVLGRRVRTHAGEIDLIARSPLGIVCFVEVKVRRSLRDAQEALLPHQQARIARAAELYLARWRGLAVKGVRFDTIVISERHWPRHLRDAWRPGAG
ncbi:MAG TPA: YraN family protein [Rhizomicrobium sp.]